ncbi:MAG: WD40/YVTN/BNR-like repeat-containing protein, partial [Candidatus Zixiibacteriota bacterium]
MIRIALILTLLAFGQAGSQSWETIGFPSPEPITGIVMFSPDSGCVVTADGNFVRTSDRGKSWLRAEDISGARLEGICFVDRKSGWICGHKGKIFATADGGHNWANQSWQDTL